ncbi:restriction endonuclease subunit S [Klebsiella sp. K5-233]|uniref:Restriction modification system DNA specificity domain protein n=5 Tax=Klebsiella pneumoniae TaxID=573 RepID=A0ABD7NUX0_KLEPN|nr:MULTISPECIES: restriction endonuclease subunit S [Klebsiella]MBL2090811.1 restriction endonuclease subunit S [Klebsiella pneumoniae]MBN7754108.1 restriction endonuclease subunit S [Klebsiella pneumoniae]MCJ7289249.1 restriction endonuclease subunit S [Klebsiella pneumoniae]MDK1789743.1 restriction endonuclease subunit S [Klebsiella pneumoniae]MDK1821705.1 restriction endonuclease subunit S [Klebsiella sp. K6-148]
MSEMSYLEKLLDGAEVEWKPLREVCDFKNGFAFKSNLFKETGLPIVRITNIDGFNVNLDEVKYFSPNDYKEDISSFEVSMGDIVIAMSGATTGKVGFYKNETRCYLNQRVGKFVPKRNLLNNKYLYHFLLLNTEAIYILAGGGAQPNLSSNALMSKLLIPIPSSSNPEKSLAIQSEIVRILDKFTALTAELTAELTMRKKQYNYYRDQLLSFDEGEVEWKTLGEITRKIASGRNKTRQAEGDFPVYGSTGLLGFTNEPAYSGDLLLVARVGAYAGLVNAVSGHFDVSDNTLIIHPSDSWNSRFAFHQLTHMNLNQYAVGAGQPLITGGMLKNLKVPVPSLNEQTRIAKILDKFETITVSITEGLPREIELRQKQYEYYRDLLFSFPKPEIASY